MSNNLELQIYPAPILRKPARRIKKISRRIQEYAEGMFEIMDSAKGIGLAAQQVGLDIQIIVLNVPLDETSAVFREALINPTVVKKSRDRETREEGCLSFPGLYFEVTRPSKVTVEALTLDKKRIQVETSGLLARALQHEIDHLHGKLYIDYLPAKERKECEASFLRDRG